MSSDDQRAPGKTRCHHRPLSPLVEPPFPLAAAGVLSLYF